MVDELIDELNNKELSDESYEPTDSKRFFSVFCVYFYLFLYCRLLYFMDRIPKFVCS